MNKIQKLNQEKLIMWRGKLLQLEEEYKGIMTRKGEAAAMGDLSENAAYQMLTEDAEKWRVKMDEVRNIIKKLEAN
ncbi:hypothetical protein HY385_02770 [Candidatus Daviesbacteria bacterium]|nr:hypothetical protein [Candidatus Daviesbacteria bacterium]